MSALSARDFPALCTLVEHQNCLAALASLESLLDHPIGDGAAWLAAVQDVLPRIWGALREHFASEEAGPLFRSLPQEFPQLEDRLQRLQAEHGSLLHQVAAMCERAGALEDPETYDLRELCGRLQLLLAVIRRHEAEEDEAVLSAYWQEAGTGD